MIMKRNTSNKLVDSILKRLIKVIFEIIEKPLLWNIWVLRKCRNSVIFR